MKHLPNTSPMWCNVTPMSASINNYDGEFWYSWSPENWIIWYDTPFVEEVLDGNLCYKINGNIWICPIAKTNGNINQEQISITTANVKPSLTLTSVKMENHPEHVAVVFAQICNSLSK